jgi:membrane fusion protein (multidrug efflux system)
MRFSGKTGSLLIASALISSILLFGSCSNGDSRQTNRGGGQGGLIPVEAVIVTPQLLHDKIVTTGTLMANEEVELRPEISGRVTGVFFEEGKRVKKGQLLVKINDSQLKAEFKQKEVAEKLALDNEERGRRLLDIKGISKEEYDKLKNALEMAQAEKEALQAQLDETEIVAPFNGVIGLRHVSEGGYVTSDMLVASLQETDPMKVEFSVPEKYAGQIKNGTKIIVRVGESASEHHGTVYAVESKIDLNTRTIKARAKIPNTDGRLIPGSFAEVEITLADYPDAIVIPSEAIVPEISGEKVYVCKDGKASAVPVTTGIRTDTRVQITRGLSAGDTLIVSGLLQIADGKGIQIKAIKAD